MTSTGYKNSSHRYVEKKLRILSENLSLLWKVGGGVVLCVVLYLWAYLRTIGWGGLLLPSLTSIDTLIALLVVVVSFSLSVLIFWLLPGGFLTWGFVSLRVSKKSARYLLFIIISLIFLWAYGLYFVAFNIQYSKYLLWLVLLVVLGFVFFLRKNITEGVDFAETCSPSLLVLTERREKQSIGKWRRCVVLVFYVIVFYVFLILTIFPLWFFLRYAQGINGIDDFDGRVVVIILIVASVLSGIPAAVYMALRSLGKDNKESLLGLLFSLPLLGYIIIFMAPYGNYGNFLLAISGVVNNKASYYHVIDKNMDSVFKEVGLPVSYRAGQVFVRAYLRYSVGEIRLLCKERYNPTNIENKDVPQIGGACVAIYAGDIREYRESQAWGP